MTTADCQRIYNTLKKSGRVKCTARSGKGLSDASVRSVHLLLHEMMEHARQKKLVAVNPTVGTVVPKQNSAEMKVLNEEQLDIYLEIIRSDPFWHDFFYLELTTGLRLGELCALRCEDYEQSNGTLRISRTLGDSGDVVAVGDPKTDAGKRVIFLPQSTATVMTERLKKKYSSWIFPSLDEPEKPVSKSSAYHRHKYFLRAAGLPDIRFHDLRHTFATMALEHGMDVKTLSMIIRHSSSQTTIDIYSHITTEMQKNAARAIERGIGKSNISIDEEKVPRQEQHERVRYSPKLPKYRKPGTGGVYMINDHLYEGRYTPRMPDGKRKSFNVYAQTREACEEKLAGMIADVKAKVAEEKAEKQ